jgi:hypothetical protein
MAVHGRAEAIRHAGLLPALETEANRAMDRVGRWIARFDVSGLGLRVQYAAPELRDAMLPAMAHALSDSPSDPDLDVWVWESARSGVALPPVAGLPGDHTPYGLGRVHRSGSVLSFFDHWACSLTVLDLDRRGGVFWLPDAASLPDSAHAAPLQALLNWWLPARGRAVVHGSAVSTEAGAVLLLGASGAGKSTTALACVDAGFGYLGDDLCAVTLEPAAVVHSVYCSVKVLGDDLRHFPQLAGKVVRPERPLQKAIAYVARWGPDVVERRRPLRAAVVLLDKGRPAPELEPITAAAALRAVAPGTFLNFPGHDQSELVALGRLVTRVPCYRMGLASDRDANPRALRRLLEGSA